MASNMKDEVQCPICTDTLRKPIRMLKCGHNLCHECLKQLVRSSPNARCPICRGNITLGSKGLEGIPRNRALENVIEGMRRFNISTTSTSESKSDMSDGGPIGQLKVLSESYKQEGNHQKAAEVLRLVIEQAYGWEKIKPTLDLVECLLDLGRLKEAFDFCDEITSIVDSIQTVSSEESKSICDKSLTDVILKIINLQKFDCATKMIKCRCAFVKKQFEKESRLRKLVNVAWLVTTQSEVMVKQKKEKNIKTLYSLLQNIIDCLQKTKDVDLKFKCKQVAWALKHFGNCGMNAKDYNKAMILNNAAITLMETVFGEESSSCQVVGRCYNNVGVANENTQQLLEAQRAFMKSIEIKSRATDWPSEHEKAIILKTAKTNLERVKRKLSKN